MSRINACRIINLSYNNNTMRIDDETFNLGGDNTLMCLRNGGGKSVLVQMLMAPFMNKRYRDLKDREFKSYFTNNTPTYILVEWVLDGRASYVLTGMMVKKKSTYSDEDSKDDLDIINFIHEYKGKNKYDINSIPFVEIEGSSKKVKSFSNSKTLLEQIKKSGDNNLNYYDMSIPTQSRSYFERLKEYKINNKEWETIIKKVNMKESGLSELFLDAKNVSGLVEKWFLKTVEDKLNRDEDRIKKFHDIVIKFIKQYKENKSKIDKKEAIDKFYLETEELLNKAEAFKESRENTLYLENMVGNLLEILNEKMELHKGEVENLFQNIEEIDENIFLINYEKESYELYEILHERKELESKIEALRNEIENTKFNKKSLERDKNIQECSKIHMEYMELSKEVQEYENKLELLKRKNEDLAPERNNLGYTLKNYYENRSEEGKKTLNEVEERLVSLGKEEVSLKSLLKECEKELSKLISELGAYNEKIKAYTSRENEFNKKYNESLGRNILGIYNEGLLASLENKYRENIETIRKEIEALKNENIFKKEEEKRKGREHTDLIKSEADIKNKIYRLNEDIKKAETELDERRNILKYVDLNESYMFKKENMLKAFSDKLTLLYNDEKALTIEINNEQEELNKLKTGKVLELPEDIEKELIKNNISIIYGMEWVRKNGYSKKKNEEIVKNNTFIPYSLIMSGSDIDKIRNLDLEVFTSYPIPIIKKEDLETLKNEQHNKIQELGNVKFLVSFNNKLIDENELKVLIKEKEEHVSHLESKKNKKHEEVVFYNEKKMKIDNSTLDENIYKGLYKTLENEEKELENTEEKVNEINSYLDKIRSLIDKNEQSIRENESKEINLINKSKDFEVLREQYKEYENHKRKLIELREKEEVLSSTINEYKKKEEELSKEKSENENRRRDIQGNLKDIGDKLNKYLAFISGEIINKDIEDIEARYDSLTKEISGEEKDIEERLQRARNKLRSKEDELIRTQDEYELKDKDFKEVIYDIFKEKLIKGEIAAKVQEIDKLNSRYNEVDKKLAVTNNNYDRKITKIRDELGKEEPIDKSLIVEINFKERIALQNIEKKKISEEIKGTDKIIKEIGNNIDALSQYDNLVIKEKIELQVDYENLSKYRGEMVRDYNNSKDKEKDHRYDIEKELGRLMRIEEFSKEEFFKKPLETLELCTHDPEKILENLSTTIEAYRFIVEKLQADIELIQREKENVLDTLLQYVNTVHENMGKIDKNSSVNIRGRSIQMLKIILPSWEDNLELYNIRLNDMMDRLTMNALKLLDENKNIEEIVGKEITTKNLYDELISISNIDIKLYKIEKESERLISWDEVSKNSGGEGFLSAFVILNSLLSYIRRDENDIFLEKESGKVLLMDNPFAQTNAAHLLKPLMDIAKKSNTQLICLSGLGGDSIYDRFDNIYVMNLISSKLKRGLHYLKGEQIKGEEVMVAANFRIHEEVEQSSLF